MKKDFDFEDIGKQVPYRVPEGFFEEMQQRVAERTQQPAKRRTWLLRLSPVMLAAAAVLSGIIFLPEITNVPRVENFSQVTVDNNSWIENISDEDLEAMDDFLSYDIFMD